MAICHEMKEGDVFFCELCGLELRVEKTCSCGTGEDACSVPLQCCGQDMTKKEWKSSVTMIFYKNHTAMKDRVVPGSEAEPVGLRGSITATAFWVM
jgi:hypothetical protein